MKQLVEIQERILEADIWDDSVFRRFLIQKSQGNVLGHDTETARIRQFVVSQISKSDLAEAPMVFLN